MMRGLSGSTGSCPWCGTALPPGQGEIDLCGRCGRSPAQHPSAKGTGGLSLGLGSVPPPASAEAEDDGGGLFAARPALKRPSRGSARIPSKHKMERIEEGPSDDTPLKGLVEGVDDGQGLGLAVELDRDVPAPAPAKRKAPAPRGGLGLLDDDDDDQGESLDIGLDMGSVPPKAPPPPSSGDGAPPSLPQPPTSMPSPGDGPAPVVSLPSPGPVVSARPPPAVDPEKVRLLAGYGPFPPNIAATPLYALKVIKRRFELKKLYQQQIELHADTVRTLRDELADEVSQLVRGDEGGALDDLERTLAEADGVVAERQKVMDAASSAFAARFKALEDALAKHQEARKEAVKARDMAQIAVEDAGQKRRAVEEELKRVESRLAAAHEQAREAAGAGAEFAPPEHAKRIAALQGEAAEVGKRLAEHDRVLAEARRQLRERDKAIKSVDAAIADVHRQNASLEKEAGQTHGAAMEALKQAQSYRHALYEQALERIRSQHATMIGTELAQRIDAVNERIKDADVELEAHRLALDVYDKDGFKRGVAILGLVGLIVLLVLGTFVRIALV